MSFFRKKIIPKPYDKENKKPMIKASICNGEQVAGFIHADGHFEEVQLIRTPQELESFRARYCIPPDCVIEKIY